MSNVVADIFHRAAGLNLADQRRRGNVLQIPAGREMIVTGDLHGNRKGLNKIIRHAALGSSPQRRLVLQEIVHGPLDPRTGYDRSVELLLRAARLKVDHPQQVLFVLGNHDIAQVTGNEIIKNGRSFCKAFAAGVEYCFEDQAAEVSEAMDEFLMSMPLAIRCANDVWISHSLPAAARMSLAGTDIFDRPYNREDLARGKPVYEWTWGRGQTDEQMDQLAADLGVEFFIVGHQPCEQGFQRLGRRGLIVASDHPRGCIVQFSTDLPVTDDNVRGLVKPIVSL